MIALSFAVSLCILFFYIRIKDLEPPNVYVGSGKELDLIQRAKAVIYYKNLSIMVNAVFPILTAGLTITVFVKESFNGLFTNILCSTINGTILSIATLIIVSLLTKYQLKLAIKKGKLYNYIGGMWYQVVDEDKLSPGD